MTQNKQTGKVRSRKLFYRRGIILLASIIGVGLLYYLVPSKLKKPVVAPPKIIANEVISTDFKVNTFTEGTETSLLQEIGICDSLEQNPNLYPCSPNLFKFFKLNQKKSLKDGFIVVINSDLYREPNTVFASRRILIYEREAGYLVCLNKMKGDIIEMRASKNSYYKDLIIRFRQTKYNEAYHCLYQWKKGRYEFVRCEELFSDYCKGKVKQELMDSVSIEVNKKLIEEGFSN